MKIVKFYIEHEELQEMILNKLEEKYKDAEILPKSVLISDIEGTITFECYVASKWEDESDNDLRNIRRTRLI